MRLRRNRAAQDQGYRDRGLPPNQTFPRVRGAALGDLADGLDYLVRLAGIDHVGLGATSKASTTTRGPRAWTTPASCRAATPRPICASCCPPIGAAPSPAGCCRGREGAAPPAAQAQGRTG